ncbi:MAG: hypothetical protein MMC23_004212 [Stictis urceolatum]|nr:hypothetical protein [Stictis urceolata]
MPVLPNPFQPPSANLSVVSWQTAFWALFTLALNTFIQDPCTNSSISTESYLASSRRVLRLSPIFCLLDTLRLGFYIITGLWLRLPLRQTIRLIAKREIVSVVVDTSSDDTEEVTRTTGPPQGPDGLDHRWILRALLGFGALLQLIKLLGLRGVPWTQAWGMAYFISYLQVEIVQWVASRNHDHFAVAPSQSLTEAWSKTDATAVGLQITGRIFHWQLWAWVCILYLNKDSNPPPDLDFLEYDATGFTSFIRSLFCALAFICLNMASTLVPSCIAVTLCIVVCDLVCDRENAFAEGGMPTFWTLSSAFVIGLSVAHLSIKVIIPFLWDRGGKMIVWYLGLWMNAWTLLALLIATMLFALVALSWTWLGVYAKHLLSPKKSYEDYHMLVIEVVLDFGLSLFYYSTLYEPLGTVKPGWTENLGKL